MDKINNIIEFRILLLLLTCVAVQSCNYNDNKYLGSDYVYYADHKMIVSSTGESSGIPSTVIEYCYDKRFIIAAQEPIENDPNALLYDDIYEYTEGYNAIYYWIISKDQKRVYGPLSSIDFVKMKDSLIISKELKFKNSNLK